MTYGGRVLPPDPYAPAPGGAFVPSPRGPSSSSQPRPYPMQPSAAPQPPRESGVAAGTTYPDGARGAAAALRQRGVQPAGKQRSAAAGKHHMQHHVQQRQRQDRGVSVMGQGLDFATEQAAAERAVELMRREVLARRYLAGGQGARGGRGVVSEGGGGVDSAWVDEVLYRGVGAGGGRARQQRPASAGRGVAGRRLEGPGDQLGHGMGGQFARPVTHSEQQAYVSDLQVHRAAARRGGEVVVEGGGLEVEAVAAAEAVRQPTAREQRQAARRAMEVAAAEGRPEPSRLGVGPVMTKGPLGIPVPRVPGGAGVTSAGGGGFGGPAKRGLGDAGQAVQLQHMSPREAALARAAAYMSGRGATELMGVAGVGLGAGVGPGKGGGGAGGGEGAVAEPAGRGIRAVGAVAEQQFVVGPTVGVQAAPEYAPRNPRIMSAPAGRVGPGGGASSSRGSSGAGTPSGGVGRLGGGVKGGAAGALAGGGDVGRALLQQAAGGRVEGGAVVGGAAVGKGRGVGAGQVASGRPPRPPSGRR